MNDIHFESNLQLFMVYVKLDKCDILGRFGYT